MKGCLAVALGLIVIASYLAGCVEEDSGVDYETPFNVWMEEISTNEAEQRFEMKLQLTDVDDFVTEYDGEFRVIIYDEGLNQVMDKTYKAKAKDFTTEQVNFVFDTWYDINVPWSEIPDLTPAMKDNPEVNVTVEVWFTFGDTVIKSPPRFDDPVEVFSRIIYVDEVNEIVTVEVSLFDEYEYITKKDGELRFMIRDSTGFEMYNGTTTVTASEFEILWDDDEEYYVADYHGDIDFDDIELSNDRMLDGREMALETWFTFDGVTVNQDEYASLLPILAVEIPQGLLVANLPPVPHIATESIGAIDAVSKFSARETTDDTGNEGLWYEWDWGDGTQKESFLLNYSVHVYKEAGIYDVTLNVTDFEGGWDLLTVTIEIVANPFITVDDVGIVTEAGEHYNDTYVVVTVENVLNGEAVTVPALTAALYDASEEMASLNGTDVDWPTYIGFGGEDVVILYFSSEIVGFDPVKLVIWDREFQLTS